MLKITRISSSSWFKFNFKNQVIYVDPGFSGDIEQQHLPLRDLNEDADLILISHVHMDHLKKEAIERIWKEKTKILASKSCVGHLDYPMDVILPEVTIQTHGITIQTLYAYNTVEGRSTRKYHPKEDFLGFVLYFDDLKVYFAGDTDITPEMKSLKDIDLAMLPISGTYVMDLDEAIDACNILKPAFVIPMHQGQENLDTFKEKAMKLTSSTPIILHNGDAHLF